MYHPTIIQQNIDRAIQSCVLGKDSAGKGVRPEYHTKFEVAQAIRQLDSTREMDDDGNIHILRPFTPDEIKWMENERLLCRMDFHYFASRYCWIKNAFDQIVQFEPWVSQKIFLDMVGEMELEQIAIMIQQLKARQLGISRIISLMILHRTIFFPNVNAVIGSSTPTKTIKLLDMFEFPFDRLPFWMVPTITSRKKDGEGGLLEFGKMDTGITLQHGSQMSGIARGSTPTIAHLTELAEFNNAESIVDASLMRAMHDSPRTMLILEGTGDGQYNWWHNKWISTKLGWPERKSRLRPNFLPWFTGSDLYPTAAWLRAHPVPYNYVPEPHVIDHARKACEYVASYELLQKYLGVGWKMPIEQQWFYEVEYDEAHRNKRIPSFLQEMPASDDEAFQSTNLSVFETEVIAAHKNRIQTPVGVYGLIGPLDEVPARCQPHATQVDSTRPHIDVVSNWGTRAAIKYTLVPLRWGGFSTDAGMDKIYIWEMPEKGEIYGLGVDTSYGVGKDRTTIQVIRKGNPYRPAAQVAEFCSDKLNALDCVCFCMALGTLFSVEDNTVDGFRRQPRAAIECKGNGDQTQLQMRFRGWTNFHPWQRIDNKKLDPSQFNKIGVYTNEWFRAGMLEFMTKMLRDMELEIRSPWFIMEMQTLESRMDIQAIKAAQGAHDDRFFAMGFIVISLYQWEKDRPVSTARAKPAPEAAVRMYAGYRASGQETD